jgi:hypothetical protein
MPRGIPNGIPHWDGCYAIEGTYAGQCIRPMEMIDQLSDEDYEAYASRYVKWIPTDKLKARLAVLQNEGRKEVLADRTPAERVRHHRTVDRIKRLLATKST